MREGGREGGRGIRGNVGACEQAKHPKNVDEDPRPRRDPVNQEQKPIGPGYGVTCLALAFGQVLGTGPSLSSRYSAQQQAMDSKPSPEAFPS